MSRTDPQFNLRIPESLRDWVMTAAKQNKRSATAEILARLERSFTEPDVMGVSDLERMDPESVFYTPPAGEHGVTTKIDKDQLIAGSTDDFDPYQPGVSDAIRKAYEAIKSLDMLMGNMSSAKGPKPRKRYPKE